MHSHNNKQLKEIIQSLETKKLPLDEDHACKIAFQSSLLMTVDSVLYFLNPKSRGKL